MALPDYVPESVGRPWSGRPCYIGVVPRSMQSLLPLVALLVPFASCKADKVDGGGSPQEDGGAPEVLPAPTLTNVPETTPNATVAIRGESEGQRVVVQGGANGTNVVAILPGGAFCTDVELKDGTPTELTIYAIGDGLISEATSTLVSKDSTAPQPPSPTCSGSSPNDCEENTEICDNEEDENCDGWIDECDSQCNDCVDDNLEPNDFAINVPVVEPGTYQLQICPCRDDWFAFEKAMGQRIRVTADFVHETVPLNLRLYKATATGEQGEFVAGSFSSTNQESIDEVVDADGLYLLRAYPFGGTGPHVGAYTLTIQ